MIFPFIFGILTVVLRYMTPPIFSVTVTLNMAYPYRKYKYQTPHICLLFMKQHLGLSVLVELKCRVHIELELVSRILGHTSTQTTRIYASPSIEMLKTAMENGSVDISEVAKWMDNEEELARSVE